VTEALSDTLGVPVGGTDPTGTFTLLEFECLGACDRAPVVMVNNDHWHETLTPERVPQFVNDLRVKGLAALTGCHHKVD
jgi:NADH-quinone oxidoreductase subunit E